MNRLTWLMAVVLAGCTGELKLAQPINDGDEAELSNSLKCVELTVETGAIGQGQSARALDRAELSGTTDNWDRYVEFTQGTRAVCRFMISLTTPLDALSLRVNYLGPTFNDMPVQFEVFDRVLGAWVKVFDNGFARDWVWTRNTAPLPGEPYRFVANDGSIRIRYLNGTADVSDLDQLVLLMTLRQDGAVDSGVIVTPPVVVDAGTKPPTVDAGTKPPVSDAGTKPPTIDAGTPPVVVDAGTRPPTVDAGTPPPAGSWWKPTAAAPIHWHWQLSENFQYPRDVKPNVTVYDIDGEQATAALVAQLHALGPNVKVICYMDVGVYEDYRSDAAKFPKSIIGNKDVGWAGSYWLDVRQLDVLMPILRERMINWCVNKGFDALEPDESEVWSNNSGFPITHAQNSAFNKAVADMAHSLGLSVGLKGNNTEAAELEPYFDWALSEQCWEYSECEGFRDSFVKKNKAVFTVEYNVNPNCSLANQYHLNSSRRDLDLVGPKNSSYLYQPCIPDTQNTW